MRIFPRSDSHPPPSRIPARVVDGQLILQILASPAYPLARQTKVHPVRD